MRKIFIFCVAVSVAGLLAGCKKNDDVKKHILMMQSRPVVLGLDKMQCMTGGRDTVVTDYTDALLRMVVYVDSSECSSCALDRMFTWNDAIRDAGRYNGRLRHLFIVAPRKEQMEDVYLSLEYSGLKSPVYVDTAYVFRQENPHIPAAGMYHVFLLDRNDSVLLVGNPLNNPKIDKIFKRTVTSIIN